MDYILASILQHHSSALHKVISYDIACQWSKHLLKRLRALPRKIRLKEVGSYITVIPKLHSNAHNPPCPTAYSLNYIDGAGCTNGEAIERTYAATGLLSGSTKQMGPGYRHDSLDTHWQFWNWGKITGGLVRAVFIMSFIYTLNHTTGASLYKKLFVAYIGAEEQMVKAWEVDHSQPDPYAVPKSGKPF